MCGVRSFVLASRGLDKVLGPMIKFKQLYKRLIKDMNQKLFIPIVLGTNREGRRSFNVAKVLEKSVEKRENIETKFFDVKDFAFPQEGYGEDIKDQFPEWRDAVARADGLILVVPEYNHGYPGTLKSVLDLLFSEYKHKVVGLVGVAAGSWGGVRAIESLLPVMRELGLVTLSIDLQFPRVQELFNEKGELMDDAYEKRVANFLDELEWMGQTLKQGRENSKAKE